MSAPHQVTEVYAPGSPEWQKVITPSKVASILGVSRFQSQYALWHQMAGLTERKITEKDQELFDYGHAAEAAARLWWQYRNPGWRISPGEVQLTNPQLPFDNRATIDGRASRGRSRRVVEVKTSRDMGEFGDDGSGEVPIDYAAQVTMQMMVTGWTDLPAHLVLWPAFGYPQLYEVAFDEELAAVIVEACVAWTASLDAGTPPELDDSLTTYTTVRDLHPDIDGTTVELDPALAAAYLAANAAEKEATAAHRGLKSQVLDAMKCAQKAEVGGVKIADRRPNKYGVSLYANAKATIPNQENQ